MRDLKNTFVQLGTWLKSMLKTRDMSVIGLHIEQEQVHLAHLVKEKGKIRVLSTSTIPLKSFTPPQNVRVVTGLELHEVVFRTLLLPLKSSQKVLSALPFQLESLLPFAPDQTIIHPFLKPQDKHSTAVFLIATSKDLLQDHLAHFASLNIDPDVVTALPLALYRLAKWLHPAHTTLLVFHFGKQRTSCILIQDDEITLSQSIKIGREDLEQKEHFINELRRLHFFIQDKVRLTEDLPWMLFGESASSVSDLWKEVFSDRRLEAEGFDTHCLSIGFALDAIASDTHSLQLRQKEFAPTQRVNERKKGLITYMAGCALLSLFLFCASHVVLQRKTNALSDKMLAYFPKANATSLSQNQMESDLETLEKTLVKQKSSFPFFLTVPKVSEVLAWLSTHSAFVTPEGLPKEGIDIKSLRYQLMKYPTLEEPSIPYIAQVEIEFTAITPRLAREFHDALLKGDPIVNAKKEIKWHAQGTNYSLQFELNKSPAS